MAPGSVLVPVPDGVWDEAVEESAGDKLVGVVGAGGLPSAPLRSPQPTHRCFQQTNNPYTVQTLPKSDTTRVTFNLEMQALQLPAGFSGRTAACCNRSRQLVPLQGSR